MTRIHRSDLDQLPDYDITHVPDPTRVCKLDANENPYGPSPRAVEAIHRMQGWQYYGHQEELRGAIADYVGLGYENVVVSNGADESIDLVLRTVLEPGDVVVDCPPTFGMYRITALSHRARVVEVHRRNDFSLDVAAVVETAQRAAATVVIVCSPNNPDGQCLPRQDLDKLLQLPALILLDEAYAEFSGESASHLVRQHENLVILRTFSKWAGLAGLRVGYALLPPALTRAVLKVKSPYNVNAAGLIAALASLEDRDHLMGNVRAILDERERMGEELSALRWIQPLPSCANFLLCHITGMDNQSLMRALAAQDIIIRAYSSPRLHDYVRISVGTPQQTDLLLAALNEIGKQVNPK